MPRPTGIAALTACLAFAGLGAPSAHAVKAAASTPELKTCITKAAAHYEVPEPLIWLILDVEGGEAGTVSGNSNGTDDLGPMQINTFWLPLIEEHYERPRALLRRQLQNDACFNIAVGTWILRVNIDEAGGNIWQGMGWYHSRTPSHARKYLDRVLAAAERWYGVRPDVSVSFQK